MGTIISYGILFVVTFLISCFATPYIKKLAIAVGAVDRPDYRKVHSKIMPRMGGLAIVISFMVSFISVVAFDLLDVDSPMFGDRQIIGFILGGLIITAIGMIDDKYQISAKSKLFGQLVAAVVVVSFGIQVEFITLPDYGRFEFGWLSIPFTLFWIIGVTNALNLIDGLDGLAAGVSSIALATISIIGFSMGNVIVAFMALLLLAGTLGFLVHNFYPAKIFMGDTGALFLGYNLAIFSILGFKHVTLVSFIIPILILGVPIADTLLAIVRRFLSKQPIGAPDKNHLHHCLLKMGYSHRKTVFIIYGISLFFSVTAIIFSQAEVWMAFTVLGVVLIVFTIGADVINILNRRDRTVMHVEYSDNKSNLKG